MTKVLCVGDIHARDKAPRGATEPYMEDLLDLLRQTVKLAEELKVDAVVWSGDVFHEKEPRKTSHATVQRMIEIVQSHTVPLYILPGNHDVSNSRLDSIDEKQPLGVLYRSGAKRLDGWADELLVYGIPWQEGDWNDTPLDPDEDPFWGWTEATHRPASLLVTHASLYPPGTEPPFDVLDIEKLAEVVGHGSVYYGHIHEDHGVYNVGDVQFANMGALSRGSRHEYNVERDIKVCTWEDGVFEEIILDYRPAEDVLLMEEHAEARKEKMDLDGFIASIGSKALEISSTSSVVDYINTRKDVPSLVRKRAVALLENVS